MHTAHQVRCVRRLYKEYVMELGDGHLTPITQVDLKLNGIQAMHIIKATVHVYLVNHLATCAHLLLLLIATVLALSGLLRSAWLHVQVAVWVRIILNTNAAQAFQLESHPDATLANFQLWQATQALSVGILHATHQLKRMANGRNYEWR